MARVLLFACPPYAFRLWTPSRTSSSVGTPVRVWRSALIWFVQKVLGSSPGSSPWWAASIAPAVLKPAVAFPLNHNLVIHVDAATSVFASSLIVFVAGSAAPVP